MLSVPYDDMFSIKVNIKATIIKKIICSDWKTKSKIVIVATKKVIDLYKILFLEKSPVNPAKGSEIAKIKIDAKKFFGEPGASRYVIRIPNGKNISPYVFLLTSWMEEKNL